MSALPTPSKDLASLNLTHPIDEPVGNIAHPGTRSPMSDAHYEQLRQICKRARPIERAAGYAKFSGWTTLLAGAFSLPFSLKSMAMLIFCVCLAGIGTRELTLRRKLLALETTTPKKLAINQLVLGFTLTAYAIFMLISAPGDSMMQSAIGSDPMLQSVPELSGMMDDMANLERLAKALIYAGLIVIAVFVQGSTAIYYACKAKALRKLHKHSPEWCVRVYQTMNAS